MLVNRDRDHDHAVKMKFANAATGRHSYFSGAISQTTLGPAQYQWHSGGEMGHVDPDGPASKSTTVNGLEDTLYDLQKASITVIRGKVN